MSLSPTALSLRHLRDAGWTAEVVEKWNPHARIRQDLFGFIDILAVRGDTTLGVQATSDNGGNVAARVRKMGEAADVGAVREAGWALECHGWKKVRGKWIVRVVDVS